VEDLYGNVRSEPVSWTFVIKADPGPAGNEDTDKDGIVNDQDNCPFSANAGQEDMDKDGKGDVCDTDLDGDGVMNSADNCLMMANQDQLDENGDGVGDACQDLTGIPVEMAGTGYQLFVNHPNPFADKTTLKYQLPYESRVIIKVFDLSGQEVSTLIQRVVPAGTHEVTWDAGAISEGIYFCTFHAESMVTNDQAWKNIKMVLAR
jgi:hypothetical protein